MNENILALDASTKRTGYAFYKNNELQYGVIANTSTIPEKRIAAMRDGIKQILEENPQINTIVLEEVTQTGNNRTSKVLTWLQGIISVMVYEVNSKIKIELIGASSWRSKLGIQGYRTKREEQKKKDIEYANTNFNLELTSTQDDEADAICILASYLKFGASDEEPSAF